MNYSATLFGIEIGFWPALAFLSLLLFGGSLILLGVVEGLHNKQGVLKAWSGMRESKLYSRFRIFFPQLCFFFGIAFSIAALADITRTYVVVSDVYATNRLFIDIDNSSSMYNFGGGPPIHCTDTGLKRDYPRIFNACRALFNIVDATEKYAKTKGAGNQDQIGLLRFG